MARIGRKDMMRIGAAMLVMAAMAAGATADEAPLSGLYEITSRLELPHVERWAIDKTTRVCVDGARGLPLPVLSDNNPFGQCVATALTFAHGRLEYDIACPGRADASAHAAYDVTPGRFSGRIAMVLGAKNMTMTEVQDAVRMGACETAQR
jgi:hypothetical protein